MDFASALRGANEAGIQFLRIELSLAHTLLDVSTTTRLPERQFNSRYGAQRAYRGVLYFVSRVQLSTDQKLDFDRELTALKDRLVLAGVQP